MSEWFSSPWRFLEYKDFAKIVSDTPCPKCGKKTMRIVNCDSGEDIQYRVKCLNCFTSTNYYDFCDDAVCDMQEGLMTEGNYED